jgi:hypothetical protein
MAHLIISLLLECGLLIKKNKMIFWTKDIGDFKLSTGMKVIPIPCTLKDDRVGFYLADDKKEVVESKEVVTEEITIEKIKSDTAF